MLFFDHTTFLNDFFNEIKKLNIDVSEFDLDHIGYQASSSDDYEMLKKKVLEFSILRKEDVVGGRRVGIFELHEPLIYKKYKIPAMELVEPKAGQKVKSALEHAEFVVDEKLEDFMKRYPDLDWDISALDRSVYRMLKLRLSEDMQVKFHEMSILDIVSSSK